MCLHILKTQDDQLIIDDYLLDRIKEIFEIKDLSLEDAKNFIFGDVSFQNLSDFTIDINENEQLDVPIIYTCKQSLQFKKPKSL